MELGIADNTALVTGASRGLGLATARAFVRNGANVAVCGRSSAGLETAHEVLDEECAGNAGVLTVPADITDEADVDRFVSETVDTFGGIDHVVVSGGGPPSKALLETDNQDWYETTELLLMSAVWTIKRCVPHLREGKTGTVVGITAIGVREPYDDHVLSNSVRRGTLGLYKSLARELAPAVRVNAVLPGFHETARIRELATDIVEREGYDDYDQWLAETVRDIPLRRTGDPQELGNVVAFLSSERAAFITGAALPIDGGQLRS